MVTEKELIEAIEQCNAGEPTPEKMLLLSAYYNVYGHLFGSSRQESHAERLPEKQAEKIKTSGNTDFLISVTHKDADKVMAIMEELMETVKVIQPKTYDSVIRRLSAI